MWYSYVCHGLLLVWNGIFKNIATTSILKALHAKCTKEKQFCGYGIELSQINLVVNPLNI